MDFPEEKKISVPEQKILPGEENEDDDLQIIGLKVQIGSDLVYSFPVEKPKSETSNILTALENSKGTSDRHMTEAHHGCKDERVCLLNVPFVDEQVLSVGRYDGKSDNSKNKEVSPTLELKLGSFCKESKELELHIKTKTVDKDFTSDDESICSNSDYYDTEDQLYGAVSPSKGASPCIKSLQETARVHLMNITELTSRNTQTEKEFESSGVQTTSVEVFYPKSKQEAIVQTDGRCDASTSPECQKKESTEIQTENIPKSHMSMQTEAEVSTGSSQTETAAIFSIERTYNASTQTSQSADATTSTDFDIYIVDRTKVSEKFTDTNDLPYEHLMVAKEEKTKDDDLQINAKDCHHMECGKIKSLDSMENSDQEISALGKTSKHNHRCCLEKISKEFVSKLISDVSQQHYYKCSNLSTHITPEKDRDADEMLKPPDSLQLTEVECSSISYSENINDQSKVEIVKHLASAINKKVVVAVRVQNAIKFEKATVIEIPVVIQHFLNSFSLSAGNPPGFVMNPVKISLEVSQSSDSALKSDHLKLNTKISPGEELKSKTQVLTIFDGMKDKSVIVSCMPSMMAADNKHSQVCLCSNCYTNVKSVFEMKRKKFLQTNYQARTCRHDEKSSGKGKDKIRTTTPKLNPKNFDYTTRDAWTPHEHRKNVLSRKVEATDIIHIHESDSDSDHAASSEDINLNTACEIINDHLLNLRLLDEDAVRQAAETLHKAWFKTVASKHSDLQEIKFYMRYFEEFSLSLLKTLLHSTDSNGNNVLHFAFANNRFDLVEELLKNGYVAQLLKKANKTGNSPLMLCSISQPVTDSDWSAVRRSFQMGDVNAKSLKSGQTPLMNAASCGFEAMVNMLLEHGANPNLQDKDGSTALMYAAEHGRDKCAKILMRHNMCDPTIKDMDGQTACSIALSTGHKNIAVLIHMQAQEKRQLRKNPHSTKRYAWTSNGLKTKAATVTPRSRSIHSSDIY